MSYTSFGKVGANGAATDKKEEMRVKKYVGIGF